MQKPPLTQEQIELRQQMRNHQLVVEGLGLYYFNRGFGSIKKDVEIMATSTEADAVGVIDPFLTKSVCINDNLNPDADKNYRYVYDGPPPPVKPLPPSTPAPAQKKTLRLIK